MRSRRGSPQDCRLGGSRFWFIGCGCASHLFGMACDPVHSRPFIDLLQYFRIDRLEKYL
jgi:sugar fermentation stimulation protein A